MDNFEQGIPSGMDAEGLGFFGRGDVPSYYAVLDVDVRASRVEIREAYLRLKGTYGAGSAALYSLISEDEAKEQMALAEEAYRVLNDDVARRNYDLNQGIGAARGAVGGSPANRGEFEPGPFGASDPQTERIMLMRSRERSSWDQPASAAASAGAGFESQGFDSDPTTIRTTRSTLHIIKLKAQKVGTEAMATIFAELVQTSDAGDGDLYRRLREAADVSEDEIAERTKISVAYIRAIEGNRFDRLPQAVYVKGFLRSYFRYLAVPESEKLVTAFSARLTDWQSNRKT